jgi:hypothetical protein
MKVPKAMYDPCPWPLREAVVSETDTVPVKILIDGFKNDVAPHICLTLDMIKEIGETVIYTSLPDLSDYCEDFGYIGDTGKSHYLKQMAIDMFDIVDYDKKQFEKIAKDFNEIADYITKRIKKDGIE